MTKTFRPYEPRQSLLFPPSPLDWLPEDHLAHFILERVQLALGDGVLVRSVRIDEDETLSAVVTRDA